MAYVNTTFFPKTNLVKDFATRLAARIAKGRVAMFFQRFTSIFDSASLDLDFATNKSLTDNISGNNLVTFTRASTATYVDSDGLIKTAATNTPRFDHDPTTGQSLGLLVEEARTNLLLNSATLSTQSVTTSATAYTLSFYGTGTVTLSGTSTAGPLVGIGSGTANRVKLTFTPTAGTLTLTVTGTVSNAQLEAGAFPTSYIPTTTAQVTRAADVARITGTNFSSWYNQSEGTAFCDFVPQRGNTTQAWAVQCGNTTATGPNSFIIGKVSNSLAYAEARINSVAQYSVSLSVPTGAMRVAYGIKNLDHRAAFNGQLAAASARSFAPLSSDNLYIGRAVNSTQYLGGTISRITYWPERLPNETLQEITQ